MKILRVIASVDPATGGPVAGLRAVTPALEKLGHTTEFLTVDDPLAGYLESFVGPVHAVGPRRGSYSFAPRVKPWLEKNVGRFDAVIVHGLWQYLGVAVHALSRERGTPYFVFPHGMLDPSLRHTYPVKHVKKWLYWAAIERRIVRDARAVLFTCEEERRLARTTFPGYHCTEKVVSYGSTEPDSDAKASQAAWRERYPALAGQRYLLFLGRLHSKKGVDVLLHGYAEALSRTTKTAPFPSLVLAGPCLDSGYLSGLHALADKLKIADRVHWTGMLTGDAKWGALRGADAFMLPSHQENFGIAVVESLACGTPVLISNRVNIWREISEDGAAIVDAPTPGGVSKMIQQWEACEPRARESMRSAARSCFEKRFDIRRAATTFAEVLSASLTDPVRLS